MHPSQRKKEGGVAAFRPATSPMSSQLSDAHSPTKRCLEVRLGHILRQHLANPPHPVGEMTEHYSAFPFRVRRAPNCGETDQ